MIVLATAGEAVTIVGVEAIKRSSKLLSLLKLIASKWAKQVTTIPEFYKQHKYSETEAAATKILDEVAELEETIQEKLGRTGHMFRCLPEEIAFAHRGLVRAKNGDYERAIHDLSEALIIDKLTSRAEEPSEEELKYQCRMLFSRAGCYEAMYESSNDTVRLDRSIDDARLNPFMDSAPLLEKLTAKKIAVGATRPFFTQDERMKIEKELCLNSFAEEKYLCLHCGKQPTSDASLRRCGRCSDAWFCSKDCQKMAWKSHKRHYCTSLVPLIFADEWRDLIAASFVDTMGGMVGSLVVTDDLASRAFVRDPETGRYFDSLTNKDVFFIPSEKDQLDELSDELNIEFRLYTD